jgi:hypothetical protein
MSAETRKIELFVALPEAQSVVVQLEGGATGSDLADEVLAELGLGVTPRNRRKLEITNRDTGSAIRHDQTLGSIGEGG